MNILANPGDETYPETHNKGKQEVYTDLEKKEMEGDILHFRTILKEHINKKSDGTKEYLEKGKWMLDLYDNYFNIKTDRHGKAG